jgi:ATP-dependent RNA helicase RhlE
MYLRTMSFEDLKLTRQFLNAVEEAGYKGPTPIQEKSIPPIRSGQDVIGIAQTGTGKTAAFLLPLLQILKYAQGDAPRVLILAPTKELVIQIHQEAVRFSRYTDLRCIALFGGIGPKAQLAELGQGVDLIVATPGRFLELYSKGGFVTNKIKHIVLDEADRMMDMGFMPQIRSVQEVIPQKRQNLLFSATFPHRVERLAEEFLLWPTRIEATKESTPSGQVTQYLVELPNFQTKQHFVAHILRDKYPEGRVLIFVRLKERAEELTKFIQTLNVGGVKSIHSNKGQNSRLNAMSSFREGNIRVLVSTDVASRGIDVPETQVVINYAVPRDPHDYIHRIGRTGRAFATGESYTLQDPSERFAMARIERLIEGKLKRIKPPEEMTISDTPAWELRAQLKEVDRERRKVDPDYQGAFHERKKRGEKKPANRKRKPRRH